MRRWALLVTLAALLPTAAQAQDKYTIKLKELGTGDSARVEIKDTTAFKLAITGDKDKPPAPPKEFKSTKHLLYTDTVLERPDPLRPPTKVKRVYDKAVTEGDPGTPGDKTRPYHGKTLLIEKKGDKYEYRIDGGEAIPGDVELNNEFTNAEQARQKKVFVPPGPVALNQMWQVDAKALLGEADKTDALQVLKSAGTAQLVKVYKKDGRLYGVIDVKLEIEFKLSPKGPKEGEGTTSENKGVMKLTFDGCIDGTFAEGRISGTAEFSGTTTVRLPNAPAMTSTASGSSVIDDAWKELPRK
jgi:hypothetical protein